MSHGELKLEFLAKLSEKQREVFLELMAGEYDRGYGDGWHDRQVTFMDGTGV